MVKSRLRKGLFSVDAISRIGDGVPVSNGCDVQQERVQKSIVQPDPEHPDTIIT